MCIRDRSNVGQFALSWPAECAADFSLNIANRLAVAQLMEWGCRSYTPSVELTAGQIEALGGRRELIVHGRLPLMQLRHCPCLLYTSRSRRLRRRTTSLSFMSGRG